MLDEKVIHACQTPAFILDRRDLVTNIRSIQSFAVDGACRTLFALKALTLHETLATTATYFDGFSASSLFEARLAREIGGEQMFLSYISPVLNADEIHEIAALSDSVTLNSLSQFSRFAPDLAQKCQIGLRINPGCSFAADERCDPCRVDSHLGIPSRKLRSVMGQNPDQFKPLSGLHFHSNHRSHDAGQLAMTIRQMEKVLGNDLHQIQWLNVGGGYFFDEHHGNQAAACELQRIRTQYELETFIEPGAAVVGSSGYFVSTVQDLTDGYDCPIATLDLTVNHWPELFEYRIKPLINGTIKNGPDEYLLAGCSCVPGDVFGRHTFAKNLGIGSRIVFPNAGAYSISKSHTFNGINLPNIYVLGDSGELKLIKHFGYEEFASRCGIETRMIV